MSIDIHVPLVYRDLLNGQKIIKREPGKIIDILNNIFEEYKGLKEKIFDDKGNLKKFVRIFIEGRGISQLDGLNTYVNDRQKVIILIALSGG